MNEPTVEGHVRAIPPGEDHVAVVEMVAPPHNFLNIHVLRDLVEALNDLDAQPECRAIVVRSVGKHFCAGRDFGTVRSSDDTSAAMYRTAQALVELNTPWVAELKGASIGAGMGLALCADHRVAADTAYLSANFVTLGLHHGFGLTATLPRVMSLHRATELLATGRKVGAAEAERIGMVDEVVPAVEVSVAAYGRAADLAGQPPLALAAVRATLRAGLAEAFASAVAHELAQQEPLTRTADFLEAATALKERRSPLFTGT